MIKIVQKDRPTISNMEFAKFPLGENTSVPAFQLLAQELASCIDFKFNPGGQLETRQPFGQYSDTELGPIYDIKACTLNDTAGTGTTDYLLCSDDTKVYYLENLTSGSGVTPVEIGAVEDSAQITPYNGVAVVSDGSYLKYCDDVTGVKMAYDGGTGGTVYDNYSGDLDGYVNITSSGVGCTFTTIAWDSGYTIPPTEVYFHGVGVTSGAATIAVEFSTTDGTEVASVNFSGTVSTSTPAYYSVEYTPTDITAEFEPGTIYRCKLKGSNFKLSYTTVSSGGALIGDATKDPVMRIHPGVPPKSEWSVVSGTRLWVYDPDRPGGLWYGNLTHLDFSTANGGGWLGVIDDSRNSFKVGAASDLYGTLYVYGTEQQPYLCQLEGTQPSEYSLPLKFQRVWSHPRCLVNTNNDLWNASRDGVDPLTGVQEYGDLRTFSVADSIMDRFSRYWTSSAFAGYHAQDGQFWLYLPGYSYVNIAHTKQPIRDDKGQIRYPWSRYTIPFTPSCFSQVNDLFLVGSSDGYIYQYNPGGYKDLGTTHIRPSFKSAYTIVPFTSIDLTGIQFMTTSSTGGKLDIDIYRNGNEATSIHTYYLNLPMADTVTLEDLEDTPLEEIEDVALTPEGVILYFDVNVNCFSFQVEVSNILIVGQPIYIDGFIVRYRVLEA